MSTHRKSGRFLTLALLVANLLLGLTIANELRPKPAGIAESPLEPASPTEQKPTPAQLDFSLQPLSHYEEILARPLFNEDRRPSEEPPVILSDNEETPFTLIGIVITPEKREALLLVKRDREVIRGLVGQWVRGWKVDSIEPDRVVVTRGGGTVEMALERKSPKVPIRKKAPRKDRKSPTPKKPRKRAA